MTLSNKATKRSWQRRKYWRPFQGIETGEAFIRTKRAEAEAEEKSRRMLGDFGGAKYLDMTIELAAGAEYINEEDVSLLIWIDRSLSPLVYCGPFQFEIQVKTPVNPWLVEREDPFETGACGLMNIVAVRRSTNEYMTFPSGTAYPVFAWRDLKIDLYPWGEHTLQTRALDFHHIYPLDHNCIIPDQFLRKSFGK